MLDAPFAYWHPGVQAAVASDHPAFQAILYAGPWLFCTPAEGGTLAVLNDWPEKGKIARRSLDFYGAPVELEDGNGLRFLPPKDPVTLHDLAFGDRAGVDLVLASGMKITVPVAMSHHRQFRLTGKQRLGKPVTEYGRLASELMEAAQKDGKLDEEDPRVWRLVAMAIGQRYRSTADMIDHLDLIALEDVDPILGVVWFGDPKALKPATDGASSSSISSDSATPSSPSEKPSTSATGQ
jgi:hypothetical protein